MALTHSTFKESANELLSQYHYESNFDSEKLTDLPENYMPSSDEEYMCLKHLEYFRRVLTNWRYELMISSCNTVDSFKAESWIGADLYELSATLNDWEFALRRRSRREIKLLERIDAALKRIKKGVFGYCEETGEMIGLKRLIARPTATLCIEAQNAHEIFEKTHNEEIYVLTAEKVPTTAYAN